MSPHPPAIVGVGVATESLSIVDLMTLATRRALLDAGGLDLGQSLDVVLVPIGTWRTGDPGRLVAAAVGSPGVRSIVAQLGVSQQGLINHALSLLERGDARRVLVLGGEARRHDRLDPEVPIEGTPDETLARPADFVHPLEVAAGIAFPAVRSYAMIERAFSHRHGLSDDEAADHTATLWRAMNEVAATNPTAAFATPRSFEWLRNPSDENPMLSAPYLRAHASQWTVDQAAALIISAEPSDHRATPAQPVYPHVALESSLAIPLIQRAELGAWPAMRVLGQAAESHLGRPLAAIELVELYSCFPVAVAVQADELGLATLPAPTISGGMAFAGGPFNNFALQALAGIVAQLRHQPGSLGLITTVSGLLTKPGLSVWSTIPPVGGHLVADLADQARSVSGQLSVADATKGSILIESSTAFRDDDGPHAVILGRDRDGKRCLIRLDSSAAFDRFAQRSSIGEHLEVPPLGGRPDPAG